MRTILRKWDLSVQEYTALSVLRLRPGLSNAQLARRTLVTPQSMLEILSKLDSRELVRRAFVSERVGVIRNDLSAEGERLLAVAGPEIVALQERIFAGLTEPQLRMLSDILATAMQRLSAGHR
jgi:DNA-binding MarR family transcriptional regulator